MNTSVGLGIDVGGTNTDAVLIDLRERKILSHAKAPTTRDDLARGISDVLKRLDRVTFPRIALISLSTTLATNSIVEGVRKRVCGLLVGYGPEDYLPGLSERIFLIPGGHNVQGEEREPLDLGKVEEALAAAGSGIEAYAVCGYFSVRNPDHERRVKKLVEERTGKPVVCGHEISLQLDAVKRATTTLLNAHLIPVIHRLLESVKRVFADERISAPLMVVKGDGSLMAEASIKDRPIETILSGPAASVIGARYLLDLSGEARDAVIVDIGGTTTDIALLREGFPRLNPAGAKVGDWQTNVMAIDIRTIGLGGDSQVSVGEEGHVLVGPRRVIPLAYLAYGHPKVLEELKELQEDPKLLAPGGSPDFWIRIGQGPEEELEPFSSEILKRTGGEPKSLPQLVRETGRAPSEVRKEVTKLERRGLLQQAGVTPTDVLHVRGTFQAWSREAAERGVRILCDRHQIDPPALIRRLEEAMDRAMGLQILDLVLSDSVKSARSLEGCGFCGFLTDQWFSREKKTEAVRFAVNLRDRLIGIGAPAHAYLPPVAERLGTESIVPYYAGVANAVGAVTSAIVVKEEATIKPYGEGVRLYTSAGMSFFEELDQASDEAKRFLRQEALRKIREAGAEDAEVLIEEQENWATARSGDRVFIEKLITGRAVGNPRIYSEPLEA